MICIVRKASVQARSERWGILISVCIAKVSEAFRDVDSLAPRDYVDQQVNGTDDMCLGGRWFSQLAFGLPCCSLSAYKG